MASPPFLVELHGCVQGGTQNRVADTTPRIPISGNTTIPLDEEILCFNLEAQSST